MSAIAELASSPERASVAVPDSLERLVPCPAEVDLRCNDISAKSAIKAVRLQELRPDLRLTAEELVLEIVCPVDDRLRKLVSSLLRISGHRMLISALSEHAGHGFLRILPETVLKELPLRAVL